MTKELFNAELPEVHESYELGGCTFLGYWAKGHWQPDKFGEGLRRNHGPEGQAKAKSECTRYRHTYARIVGDWSEGHYQPVVKVDAKPGRGAFPVTVYEP